ncbi:hypothetical protein DV515_00006377 [Chloebia gouldiae]|uniref:WH1 domain-containing protein n=1 Tax=Chloebia gouldiae TaxID=44316 RepID=A0A3L8SLY9_CHLGU|nr:hypothetical protein DV515_00006377 [Chloebia gouldiae]
MSLSDAKEREQPIFTTRAHVFQIDPSTKKNWVPASKQAVTVSYFYDSTRNSYRIISVDGAKDMHFRCDLHVLILFFFSVCDQVIINSTITPNMTFTKTSQKFGQWADSRANTVFGLGFPSEQQLTKFAEKFQEVKEAAKLARDRSQEKIETSSNHSQCPPWAAHLVPPCPSAQRGLRFLQAEEMGWGPRLSAGLAAPSCAVPSVRVKLFLAWAGAWRQEKLLNGFSRATTPFVGPTNIDLNQLCSQDEKGMCVLPLFCQESRGLSQVVWDQDYKEIGVVVLQEMQETPSVRLCVVLQESGRETPSSTRASSVNGTDDEKASHGGPAEAHLKSENDKLKIALAQSSSNVKKWETELQSLRESNARLSTALQESAASIEHWKKQFSACKEENDQLRGKIEELEEQCNEINKEKERNAQLSRRLQELETELQDKELELEELRKQGEIIPELMSECESVSEQLQAAEKKNKDLEEKVRTLRTEVEENKHRQTNLKTELKNFLDVLDGKIDELHDFRQGLSKLGVDN